MIEGFGQFHLPSHTERHVHGVGTDGQSGCNVRFKRVANHQELRGFDAAFHAEMAVFGFGFVGHHAAIVEVVGQSRALEFVEPVS